MATDQRTRSLLRSDAVDSLTTPRQRPSWTVGWRFAVVATILFLVPDLLLFRGIFFSSTLRIAGWGFPDNYQQVWFLEWPAHALATGQNIFVSHAINYPFSVNLMTNTSMILLGVLATPLTLLAGPIVTYNVLLAMGLLASALAMTYATHKIWLRPPWALLAGYIYGFSSFEISEATSHVFMVFAVFPPLIFLLLVSLILGTLSVRRAGITLGILFALCALISFERCFDTAFVTAVALVAASVIWRESLTREDVRRVVIGIGYALPVFIFVMAVPFGFVFFGPEHVSLNVHNYIALYHGYLSQFFLGGPAAFPPVAPAFHWTWNLFTSPSRNQLFVGVPLIVFLLVVIARNCRLKTTKFFLVVGTFLVLMTLGNSVYLGGSWSLWSPVRYLDELPLFSSALPERFDMFVWLLIAFVSAAVLQSWSTINVDDVTGRRLDIGRWSLATIVVSAIAISSHPIEAVFAAFIFLMIEIIRHRRRVAPGKGRVAAFAGTVALSIVLPFASLAPLVSASPGIASWFTTSSSERPLSDNKTVLWYPYPSALNDQAMLVQAQTGMKFRLVGGYAIVRGDGYGTSALPLSPKALPDMLLRTYDGSSTGALNDNILPVGPLPPLTPRTIHFFHVFVAKYHVSTIVMQWTGAKPALALKYLEAAFGEPTVIDAGTIRFWSFK